MLRLQSYDGISWKSKNSDCKVFSMCNSFKFCSFGNKSSLSFKVLSISSSLFQTLTNVKKIHRTTANNFVWICLLFSPVIVTTDTRWMLMAAVVMVRDCTALSQLQQHTAIKTTTTNFICMTINTYSVAKPLQCNELNRGQPTFFCQSKDELRTKESQFVHFRPIYFHQRKTTKYSLLCATNFQN